MARNGFPAVALIAMVVAIATTAVLADLAEDYLTGVTHFIEGAYGLADGGHLDDSTTKLVKESVTIMENQTHSFVKQYNMTHNNTDLSWESPSKTEEMSMVDGIYHVGVGSEMILNVTTTINNDEELFAEISNTTYFATVTNINDEVVMLLSAMGSGLVEDSRRRALLQNSDCDEFDIWTASDSEIRDCYVTALESTTTSLSDTQNDLYSSQYELYCKPYIRQSYSSDLKDNFKDDKSLKTCNDFSFLGLFGATRCSECVRHASEDLGKEVTQEDCRIFDNDEQQWMLDETDDGDFLIRNDEEDDHCIQAPSDSTLTYTMQKCDKSNPAQKFEVLELDTWTGDPRIMFKVAGSGAQGMCMTTLEADDDDDMPFVNKPCICSKSQIIKRDD